MDKETKERLKEIRAVMKKYGFDKILGQTAKSKIIKKDDDDQNLILDDEIPLKLRCITALCLICLRNSQILETFLWINLWQKANTLPI